MKTTPNPATDEQKQSPRKDPSVDVDSYVPPRLEKEQRLAEVTGQIGTSLP